MAGLLSLPLLIPGHRNTEEKRRAKKYYYQDGSHKVPSIKVFRNILNLSMWHEAKFGWGGGGGGLSLDSKEKKYVLSHNTEQ
jgi:hypothetical protein